MIKILSHSDKVHIANLLIFCLDIETFFHTENENGIDNDQNNQSTLIHNVTNFINNEIMWWDSAADIAVPDRSNKDNNMPNIEIVKDLKISKVIEKMFSLRFLDLFLFVFDSFIWCIQLKAKVKKLKAKIEKLEEMYSDLQHHLLLESKKQRGISNENLTSKSSKDVLKILKRRVTANLSDDGVRVFFILIIFK